eukprot:scaffold1143_cov177-Amphora_coffeaeformis.AAC.16
MSRWLSSVNHMLERLDDGVEQVSSVPQQPATTAVRGLTNLLLSSRGQRRGDDDDDDGEYDEYDEKDDYSNDEEYYEEEEEDGDEEDDTIEEDTALNSELDDTAMTSDDGMEEEDVDDNDNNDDIVDEDDNDDDEEEETLTHVSSDDNNILPTVSSESAEELLLQAELVHTGGDAGTAGIADPDSDGEESNLFEPSDDEEGEEEDNAKPVVVHNKTEKGIRTALTTTTKTATPQDTTAQPRAGRDQGHGTNNDPSKALFQQTKTTARTDDTHSKDKHRETRTATKTTSTMKSSTTMTTTTSNQRPKKYVDNESSNTTNNPVDKIQPPPQQEQSAIWKTPQKESLPPTDNNEAFFTPRQQQQQHTVASKAPPAKSTTTKAPSSVGRTRIPPPPQNNNKSSSNNNTISGNNPNTPAYSAALKRAQQEIAKLQKQLQVANARATAAETEMAAQQAELEQAAERLQADRTRATEEQEELWEDHQWEVEQLKAQHAQATKEMQTAHKQQLTDLQAKLAAVQVQRQQEGGDLEEQLQHVIEREQDALASVDALTETITKLKQETASQSQTEMDLRTQIAALEAAVNNATEHERSIEQEMDALKETHQRQLAQRQERETQLEQSVAQLSAALAQEKEASAVAVTQQQQTLTNPEHLIYKEKYQEVSEELLTCQGQLEESNSRCMALQTELEALSAERLVEVEQSQARQATHDAQVARLQAEIHRLEQNANHHTVAHYPNNKVAVDESTLQASKQQVKDLSDQLVRQQSLLDSSKSEILALKGRLQAALHRAETVEQERNQMEDVERGGWNASAAVRGVPNRRRKRGGRTMRSALGIRASASPIMMQIIQTIDALDLWMLETGLVLKHEPLARLGLLAYAVILHLWCFGLVFFHTVEAEHGDLSTIRRTVPSPHALNGVNP